ncbi:hypothetical protein HNQ88_005119 [Aureibacter tunicatorum]|uniref:Uncharacterized protein n=1 Tax=Aureibacter tunicatorum TaxID=866807 RepID=A0AAE3XSZ3_9BACT|nr:hypothetical protein [Aureibacter tunicatorum]BDD07124.1 hypothetical protein AUTU_46070 [Aureibacter tunicatorum]
MSLIGLTYACNKKVNLIIGWYLMEYMHVITTLILQFRMISLFFEQL